MPKRDNSREIAFASKTVLLIIVELLIACIDTFGQRTYHACVCSRKCFSNIQVGNTFFLQNRNVVLTLSHWRCFLYRALYRPYQT